MLLRLEDCSLNRAPVLGGDRFFQCNFFRFDFGSIFGSIKASIKKGIEKGFEEESKLRNSSLLGLSLIHI